MVKGGDVALGRLGVSNKSFSLVVSTIFVSLGGRLVRRTARRAAQHSPRVIERDSSSMNIFPFLLLLVLLLSFEIFGQHATPTPRLLSSPNAAPDYCCNNNNNNNNNML